MISIAVMERIVSPMKQAMNDINLGDDGDDFGYKMLEWYFIMMINYMIEHHFTEYFAYTSNSN